MTSADTIIAPAASLTAVDFVCRNAPVDLAGVTDVVELISDFIDFSCLPYWSVPSALKWHGVRLMKRVAARESPTINAVYKAALFDEALVFAMGLDDGINDSSTSTTTDNSSLAIVQWLSAYCPWGFAAVGVEEAARRGKLHVLEWLVENHGLFFWSDLVAGVAAENGHLDVIEWFVERDVLSPLWPVLAAASAAKHGHADIVELVISLDGPFTGEAVLNAVAVGYFEIAKRLLSCFETYEDHIVEVDLLCAAAANNHLEILQWLHENLPARCTTAVLDSAARNGHLEIVQWLLEHQPMGFNESTINVAAENGHLDIVKLVHGDQSKRATTSAMDMAAANGHLAVVHWLHENRSEGCSTKAMDGAACYGHLEIIQWLHENRSEGCSVNAMDGAASYNHLQIVQWLHENRSEGCTFRAMNNAAGNGHLEMLVWLHENREEGCTVMAMTQAAANGYFDVIKWLHANRSEGCTANAAVIPAERGHLNVLKWFYSVENLQVEWSSSEIDVASSYKVLEWLRTNRSEDGCTARAMESAASSGDLAKMLFLREHYPHVLKNVRTAALLALGNNHLGMVMWLQKNYPEQVDMAELRRMIGNSHHWKQVLDFLEPLGDNEEEEPVPDNEELNVDEPTTE